MLCLAWTLYGRTVWSMVLPISVRAWYAEPEIAPLTREIMGHAPHNSPSHSRIAIHADMLSSTKRTHRVMPIDDFNKCGKNYDYCVRQYQKTINQLWRCCGMLHEMIRMLSLRSNWSKTPQIAVMQTFLM